MVHRWTSTEGGEELTPFNSYTNISDRCTETERVHTMCALSMPAERVLRKLIQASNIHMSTCLRNEIIKSQCGKYEPCLPLKFRFMYTILMATHSCMYLFYFGSLPYLNVFRLRLFHYVYLLIFIYLHCGYVNAFSFGHEMLTCWNHAVSTGQIICHPEDF